MEPQLAFADRQQVAAQVGRKFLEKFESHEWAPRMAFRVGQSYYKLADYRKAAEAFYRCQRYVEIIEEEPG